MNVGYRREHKYIISLALYFLGLLLRVFQYYEATTSIFDRVHVEWVM